MLPYCIASIGFDFPPFSGRVGFEAAEGLTKLESGLLVECCFIYVCLRNNAVTVWQKKCFKNNCASTEVPAVSRSPVDVESPYDSEMEETQSDNVLLKSRGKHSIFKSFFKKNLKV